MGLRYAGDIKPSIVAQLAAVHAPGNMPSASSHPSDHDHQLLLREGVLRPVIRRLVYSASGQMR
jgi:hypothetical protein